jgi:hypothetical protein
MIKKKLKQDEKYSQLQYILELINEIVAEYKTLRK